MTPEPIVVVGIGADGPAGLSAEARDHIARCRLLTGGQRHLAFFSDGPDRETLVIDADLDRVVCVLGEQPLDRKIVVLASGDPLCFGIGRRLLEAFDRSRLVFLPTVGSIALAFARLKLPWDDATFVSVHGRPMDGLLDAVRAGAAKIAVLTDETNHPGAIAARLCETRFASYYEMHVCENLGGPDERITSSWPNPMAGRTFGPLNVVVLTRLSTARIAEEPVLGIPDNWFRRLSSNGGMFTKKEVRLIALSRLELRDSGVLWDIGAGSGSLSIEAARLSHRTKVYAVEADEERFAALLRFAGLHAGSNLTPVAGNAPDALKDLPDPDMVFVGGSGGRLGEILEVVLVRLRPGGRLVVNCVTMQTLTAAWHDLEARGLRPDVTSVQIARSRPLARLDALEPDRPIFIVRAVKS